MNLSYFRNHIRQGFKHLTTCSSFTKGNEDSIITGYRTYYIRRIGTVNVVGYRTGLARTCLDNSQLPRYVH